MAFVTFTRTSSNDWIIAVPFRWCMHSANHHSPLLPDAFLHRPAPDLVKLAQPQPAHMVWVSNIIVGKSPQVQEAPCWHSHSHKRLSGHQRLSLWAPPTPLWSLGCHFIQLRLMVACGYCVLCGWLTNPPGTAWAEVLFPKDSPRSSSLKCGGVASSPGTRS